MSGEEPGPSFDPNDIRRAREQRRDLFSDAQIRNPWTFVPMDNPLQTLAPPQLQQAMERLAGIAGAEGSALVDTDWRSLLDSSVSLGANEEILLEAGGQLPLEERREEQFRQVEDAEDVARTAAVEQIIEICDRLDQAGVDGAEVLETVFAEEGALAAGMLEGTEFTEDEIEAVLDDIAASFDRTLVADGIAECRDRLAGPEDGIEAETPEILRELQDRFGVQITSPERALDQLEDRLEVSEREATEAAVNRLSRAFGLQFESLDDAIERLKQRIARARGERLRFADVRARILEDEVRVFIDDGAVFDRFGDLVDRRARRAIDFAAADPPQTATIGQIAVRGEGEDATVDELDLQPGIDRFGLLEEPEPVEPTAPEREQERLEDRTEANQRADRIIELLEQ